MTGKVLVGVAALSLCCWTSSLAWGANRLQTSDEQLRIKFEAAMARLKPVLEEKVMPAFDDLAGKKGVDILAEADMALLAEVLEEAAEIHAELSPDEALNGGSSSRGTRTVRVPIYRRGLFGRCRIVGYRCICVQDDQQKDGEFGGRRPLGDNIERLTEALLARIAAGGTDARTDRLLALQVFAVLMNLDPLFESGNVEPLRP
jgi:hypothetical protein